VPAPPAPTDGDGDAVSPDVYTVGELADAVGCPAQLIRDLQQYGILVAGASVGGTAYFDPGAVVLARIGARFAELGVEPRHLRAWRNAADREAGVFEQLILPLLRQRNPQARRAAAARLDELATLGGELRSGLIAEAIRGIR
jgi:DNA-binding transcriptional MerR regulator